MYRNNFVLIITIFLFFSLGNEAISEHHNHISFTANNTSFAEVARTIEKQSGFKIYLLGNYQKLVSATITNASIEEVFEYIFRRINHAIEINYSTKIVKIVLIENTEDLSVIRDNVVDTNIEDEGEETIIEDEMTSAEVFSSRADRPPPIDR